MAISVILAASFSAYALWDNQQVYETARNVQEDLLALKPAVAENEADAVPGFEELQALNPDICAWITVDGTGIDYPVVQGETNLTYLSTDIYGESSLAGSIFLDSRNNREFTDRYNLIYGHHMDQHRMFGDLDLFKDGDFFQETTDAQLLLPEEACGFKVLGILELLESERLIFSPGHWTDGLEGLGEYVQAHALHYSEMELAKLLAQPKKMQVLALVTCSSGSTGTKTVLLLQREKVWGEEEPDEPTEPETPTEPDEPTEPETPTEPENPTEPDHPLDPGAPDAPDSPSTGDFLYILLVLMAMAAITGVRTIRKLAEEPKKTKE